MVKRSPLKPGKPLRRGKPLARMSKKKRAELRESRPVVAAVMERDGGCVLRRHQHLTGDCFGEETPHHLLKASAGGRYEARNLVDLCEGHQSFVEDYPADARRLGLVATRTIPLTEAWARMRSAGLAVGPQDISELGGEEKS